MFSLVSGDGDRSALSVTASCPLTPTPNLALKKDLFIFQLEVNISSSSPPGKRQKTKQAFGLSGPHTLNRDRSQHVWEHQRQCDILNIRRLTFTKVYPSACSQESSRQSQKGQLTLPICTVVFWHLILELSARFEMGEAKSGLIFE